MSIDYHQNQQARLAMRSVYETSDARLKAAVEAGEAIVSDGAVVFETPYGVRIERYGRALIVSCEFEQNTRRGGKIAVGLEVAYWSGREEFPDEVVEHLETEDGYGDRPVAIAKFPEIAEELLPLI